jgi:drug/metabolite transporter (DMT)-like permease
MCFVAFTFSLWNVLGKIVMRKGISPIVVATIREVGTAVLLCTCTLLLHWRSNKQLLQWPSARDFGCFLACGILGVFGLQLFYILGLDAASADLGAIFQPLTPVLVVVFGALLGIERVPICAADLGLRRSARLKLLGVAVAVGGCCLELFPNMFASPPVNSSMTLRMLKLEGGTGSPVRGVLYLLVSDIGAATFILSQKPLFASGYQPLDVIALSYGLGAACMAAAAACWQGIEPVSWYLDPLSVGVLCFVVLICGAVDYAIMTWANERLDAATVGLYGALQPPCTCLLSFLIQGELPSVWDAGGGILIVIGLVAVSHAGSMERQSWAKPGHTAAAEPETSEGTLSTWLLERQQQDAAWDAGVGSLSVSCNTFGTTRE